MRRRVVPVLLSLVLLLSACQGGASGSGSVSGSASASASASASGSASGSVSEEKKTQDVLLIRTENENHEEVYEPAPVEDLQEGNIYFVVDPEDSGHYQMVQYSGTDADGEYTWVMVHEPDLTQEELDAALAEAVEQHGAMSVSVAAIEDGKQTVSGAYGWAVKDEVPLTVDTKIRVASLSKVSVGLCAMAMKDDGIVDLDAPLSTYWGEEYTNPYTETQPSIATLMTHSSGIKSHDITMGLANMRNLLKQSWTSHEPGSWGYWFYSNFGYCLLGTTLELASNQILDDYLQTRYFEPLGIRASLYCGRLEAEEMASLYSQWGGLQRSREEQAQRAVPQAIGDGVNFCAGGLTISAKDLAKFLCVLANDGEVDGVRYLAEETVADMETPRFTVDPQTSSPFDQCLTLRQQADLLGRDRLLYHTGSAYGVYSLLSYDPDTGDGVVVITVGSPRDQNERGLYGLCSDLSEKLYEYMKGDIA